MTDKPYRHIAVDIDGVLAQFVPAFASECEQVSGLKVSRVAHKWDWVLDDGVTAAHIKAVWDRINANPTFWYELDAYPECTDTLHRLEERSSSSSIYFVSDRPANAKFWTEMWLGDRGMSVPTVLLTKQKGRLCAALGIDLFIDDKVDNVLEVYRALPCSASIYLLSQPGTADWRAAFQEEAGNGIKVVTSLDEVWEREGL